MYSGGNLKSDTLYFHLLYDIVARWTYLYSTSRKTFFYPLVRTLFSYVSDRQKLWPLSFKISELYGHVIKGMKFVRSTKSRNSSFYNNMTTLLANIGQYGTWIIWYQLLMVHRLVWVVICVLHNLVQVLYGLHQSNTVGVGLKQK